MKLPQTPPKQTRFLRSQQDLKAKFEQQQAQGEQSEGSFGFDGLVQPSARAGSSSVSLSLRRRRGGGGGSGGPL